MKVLGPIQGQKLTPRGSNSYELPPIYPREKKLQPCKSI